jgi:hypothetical protein
MMRFIRAGMVAAVALWAAADRAAAQPPSPPRLGAAVPPPGASPYLNLLRGGNPAVNYYGLVRPQQYFQGALQNLQAQQLTAAAPPAQPEGAELPATGVPAGFMTHSVYFMNLGATGMGSGMTPGRTGTSRPAVSFQPPTPPPPRTR